jgi:hypothetical protein
MRTIGAAHATRVVVRSKLREHARRLMGSAFYEPDGAPPGALAVNPSRKIDVVCSSTGSDQRAFGA